MKETQTEQQVKLLVYGSLRSGAYNNSGYKSLGTFTIPGYKLYSLGPYPGINEGEEEDKLVCEVLEVSPRTAAGIDAMELGAGYRIKEVTVEGHDCRLYVYNRDISNGPRVEDGDWIKYQEPTTI